MNATEIAMLRGDRRDDAAAPRCWRSPRPSITRMTRSRADGAGAEHSPRAARRVLRIVENLERDLNSIYLSVNIVQTIQAALVGVLAGQPVRCGRASAIGIVLNVLVLFVIAEAAPKTWALQHTERAALLTAPLVEFAGWVLRLPARALIGVANVILPGKGLKKGPFVTEEEILALAEEAMEHAVIEESERDLIESIIDFGDTVVREIMVPRTDMVIHRLGRDASPRCVDRAIEQGPVPHPGLRREHRRHRGHRLRQGRDARRARGRRGPLRAGADASCDVRPRDQAGRPSCSPRCRRARPTWRSWSTSTAAPPGSPRWRTCSRSSSARSPTSSTTRCPTSRSCPTATCW